MRTINKNAKSIKEEGYSFVLNQCLKVGTHIFSLGTLAENYRVSEYVITDEMKVDDWGYLCVVLKDVNTDLRLLERVELLACSLHTHNNNEFLTREEAEKERQLRFQEMKEREKAEKSRILRIYSENNN